MPAFKTVPRATRRGRLSPSWRPGSQRRGRRCRPRAESRPPGRSHAQGGQAAELAKAKGRDDVLGAVSSTPSVLREKVQP